MLLFCLACCVITNLPNLFFLNALGWFLALNQRVWRCRLACHLSSLGDALVAGVAVDDGVMVVSSGIRSLISSMPAKRRMVVTSIRASSIAGSLSDYHCGGQRAPARALPPPSPRETSLLAIHHPSPGERLRHHCLAASRNVRGRGHRMRL